MDIIKSGTSGLNLLFIHGIQGTRLAWTDIAQDLSQDHLCLLPNLAGRGSRRDNSRTSELNLSSFAEEINSIIKNNTKSDLVLVGWSLGVSVILEYLSLYDVGPIAGLVLISGSPALNQCQWFAQSDPKKLEEEIKERALRLQLKESAHPAATATLWSAIKSTNHEATLGEIKLPCLVIHGDLDEDCPIEHGAQLAKKIPNSIFINIPDAGHSVLNSHPEHLISSIRTFTQTLKHQGDTYATKR